jgi:hypothetical protein
MPPKVDADGEACPVDGITRIIGNWWLSVRLREDARPTIIGNIAELRGPLLKQPTFIKQVMRR